MAEAVSLNQIHRELKEIEAKMITKDELNKLIETIEIMHNPETIKQISQSKEDIKKGRVREISSVKDLLSEIQDD
ncbi:MAG TPA: hypothetical protein VI894_03550 [Candidatus Nanoarchaeia archaeon]|nr:hypothetical protein [Candidatus Nanoarchaeia archaeon]